MGRQFALLLLLACGLSFFAGCATAGPYWRDRWLDFADCFKGDVGYGFGAGAHVRAADVFSLGALSDRRQVRGKTVLERTHTAGDKRSSTSRAPRDSHGFPRRSLPTVNLVVELGKGAPRRDPHQNAECPA